jgi:hypothetical protein
MSHKPGGEDAGVVHNQTVPGLQILKNIIEMPMGNLTVGPVQNTQPGGIPLLQGGLGNQFFGKIIPKIMCFQGKTSNVSTVKHYSAITPFLQHAKQGHAA